MRAYLYGGGPGGPKNNINRFFREALADLPEHPLIAYVGAASNDDTGFAKRMSGLMAGARVEQVRLARTRDPIAPAMQLIADAHAIFLSGGDVDHGMRVLRDRGAIEPLRAAVAGGRRLIGVSAGSILAGSAWVRFPDDDDAHAEHFPCLGMLPHSFDAHGEDDDWVELRSFVRLSKDPEVVGYGLPAGGGVVADLGTPWTLHAWGQPTVRIGREAGEVVTLSPLEAE
jgi:hypothetical protein